VARNGSAGRGEARQVAAPLENGGIILLPNLPFGRTGHQSTRVIFGAAALFRNEEAVAQRALELLLQYAVNHIDVAASYGEAELAVGRWMREHRERFFLASKTGERHYGPARDQIRRSLERLQTDRLDLIQLHNLVSETDWQLAFSEDGALRAAIEAREEGLVRFIGVTGHGTRVAGMHRRSLERFAFDSVLLPYNSMQMQDPHYASEFEALTELCRERGVAVQTIKAIARRRWAEGQTPDYSTWYQPLEEQADIERAVSWALSRPDIFVNTASDVRLLEKILVAARRWQQAGQVVAPDDEELRTEQRRLAMQPLFVHGHSAHS